MKTLGEAAVELRWIAPSVASLTSLARSALPTIWSQVRTDPGIVLLFARVQGNSPAHDIDVALLEAILHQQSSFHQGFVDWRQPGPDAVLRTCCRQAALASRLVDDFGGDSRRAWLAGFLAPLGWLALSAVKPEKIAGFLEQHEANGDAAAWQPKVWGHDHTAIARRLCRRWRLPSWLASIVGNLGLHPSIAERLGADPQLFQITQLAVLLTQERGQGLGLSIGAELAELLAALQLNADEADAVATAAFTDITPAPISAEKSGLAPADCPLLVDLLQLALGNRRQNDEAWTERLQQELDSVQETLVLQCAEEKNRLQAMKLSALAEFAAGAGHEINNPLAVISGQAQYVLKQMEWLEVPAEEIENVGQYLDGLHQKIAPSLQKIITQTQRVHAILTDLMQFARPGTPKLQPVSARRLVGEVANGLDTFAVQRATQLAVPEITHDEMVLADPTQMRVALSALLRNAIEAAPLDGWAGIRIEKSSQGTLDLIVEDNGAGPCPTIREHLFDPFFSGRSAGRGRGMGLPTAWRLARQQGGDVRYDGATAGVTRFVLTVPLAPLNGELQPPHNIGYHTDAAPNGRNGAAVATS